MLGKTDNLRLLLEDTKYRELLAQESRENPQGKASFPYGIFPPAFPGCFASGLAAKGGRARSTKSSNWAVFSKQRREIISSSHHVYSAEEGAGDHPLPRGLGPRRPRGYVFCAQRGSS